MAPLHKFIKRMTFVKLTNKTDAARAVINTWLKDQTLYCNNCNTDAKYILAGGSCCENPQIGRNIDHMMGGIKQNKTIRETAQNEFGSTEDKSLRYAVSMPPRLLMTLEQYFEDHNDKLFNDNKELHDFMKAFPALCTCKVV